MKKIISLMSAALVMMSAAAIAQTFKPTFIGTAPTNGVTLTANPVGTPFILTLPADDGSAAGEVLTTNGSGVLSWTSPLLSGSSAGGDLTGTYPNPTIASTAGPNIVAALNSSGVVNSLNADVLKYNATLVVASNQLGINLGNANTWTATQTLPATAGQGDVLISSINVGTTTINAGRIGNGLTDAQVNDALTISGGAVDNTVIGGTTAAAATVTTLVVTSTSDLRGAISNSTGDVYVNDELGVGTATPFSLLSNTTTNINDAGGDGVTAESISWRKDNGGYVVALENINVASVNPHGLLVKTAKTTSGTRPLQVEAGGSPVLQVLGTGEAYISNTLKINASAVTNSRLIVNEGHWTSQGTAPTGAGDGTNLAAGITVSGTATDVAGTLTATDGGAAGVGVITVTFATAYATNPIVVVTAGNLLTAQAGFFVTNVGVNSFQISTVNNTSGNATDTYIYHFHVIENN